MKTLDEVIEACESQSVISGMVLEDVVHYLKEYQCQVKNFDYDELQELRDWYAEEKLNPALSWDELRQMAGKPVWLEYNFRIGDKEFRDKSKRWCIIREFEPWEGTEIAITENGFVLSKREQIKDWQAYRKERNNENA